jgi:amino acid transporter
VIAAAGVKEALSVAAVMTIVEILGLVAIVAGGIVNAPSEVKSGLAAVAHLPATSAAWQGLLGASLLAVFALIGFESIVNLAEETQAPARLVPWAILITLAIATLLYVAVMIVALALLSPAELGASDRPLALVFARATGLPPGLVSMIAVAATFNGIIAQLILGARLLYGLARQNVLPARLGEVEPTRGVPLNATVVAAMTATLLAFAAPLDRLADLTTQLMLIVFVAVNAALVAVKWRAEPVQGDHVVVPVVIPMAGALVCAAVLVASFVI